jgi:hypothetical protein
LSFLRGYGVLGVLVTFNAQKKGHKKKRELWGSLSFDSFLEFYITSAVSISGVLLTTNLEGFVE